MADSLYITPDFTEEQALGSKAPNYLVAVLPLDHGGKMASLTISFSTIGNNKKTAKSTLAYVMTRYPSIQTMIRLDLGGLTMDQPADDEHYKWRI